MSRIITRITLGVIMMLALVVSVSGCATEPEIDVDEVRAYADPITEDTLIGMNEDNYAQFSEHFTQTMKSVMSEANFIQLSTALKPIIGDYVSKEFWTVEKQAEYTVVKYKVKYTEEPADVIVTVSFDEVEGAIYLSGLWFDSPKLRQQ